MVDVCELARFTASGKVLRLVMDIAAALERYKIAMEGPEGVRLRKFNRIRTIHGTTAISGNTIVRFTGRRSRAMPRRSSSSF